MKKRFSLFIKLTISIGLLTFFFTRYDILSIISSIPSLPIGFWVVLLLFLFALSIVSALRWKALLPSYPFKKLLFVMLSFGFYNLILPGQLVSETSKVIILGGQTKEYEKVGVSVAIDKVLGFFGMLLLGMAGTLLSSAQGVSSMRYFYIFGMLIILLFFIAASIPVFQKLGFHILEKIEVRYKRMSKPVNVCRKLLISWKELQSRPLKLLINCVAATFYQLLIAFNYYYISLNLSVPVNFYDWLWIEPTLSLILLLPVTIGGLGLREGSLIGLLGILGVSSERSLLLSFVILVQQLLRALTGAVSELYRVLIKVKYDKLRG